MRSLILSFIFIAFSVFSYGQSELCLTAEGAPTVLAPAPSVSTLLTINPLWTANVDVYTPPNFAGPFTVGYWSFTVDINGYYNINIETPAVNTILTDVSVALSASPSCPMDASLTEIYSAIPPVTGVGVPDNATCTFFTMGTTYTIAIAVATGNEGDLTISIADAIGSSNEDCAGALALPLGTSLGDNSCSDGLVWYSYTVVNGGTVTLSVSDSGTPTAISTPVITQTNTIGCGSPDEGVTSWTCLPPGTVVYFEAGDDTAPIEQGDFNIDIVDNATGLPNELCTDVTPVAAPSCMTTTLTDVTNNTTVNACQELLDFDGCGVFNIEATVWFAFTTDAVAQTVNIEVTNGTISGATFVLIDGTLGCPSGATTEAGCQSTGSLLDQTIIANTTYYVAVATSSGGTDGTFTLTVTPENPPANDDCVTQAIDISATAALGVDGTTTCATSDANDFCIAESEDHVVYYTYTVDAGITGNRDVRFIFSTNTNTTGTAATGLFFGLFEDCVGTAYMNTPIAGDDPCDALAGTVTFECVAPGTVLTIAVGSADTEEGDFNILITEDDSAVAINDACANPTILASGPSCTDIAGAGDNTDGCPEISDLGSSCTFSSDLVVWYELTLPAGATGIDFSTLSAGAQLALFENDCPTLTLVDDCFTGDTQFTGLTAGGTYLLAVSQTFGAEGSVTFTWSPIAIPTNDDCNLANPDILLEATGTTGCADHELNTCGATNSTDDHQVFYTYTNTSGATVDLEITIEADGTNGNPATQVSITALDDDCATLTGFYPAPFSTSEWCNILGTGMQTIPCIEDGETIILLFSSVEGEEGEFTITANEGGLQPVDDNDECVDALDITPAMTCTWETVTADNTNACPEDFTFGGGCDFDVDPTVWYSFTVPAAPGNYTLEIQNITDASSYLTIFDAGIDCDAPGTAALNADCETGTGPHDMYDPLVAGTTYLIAFGNPTPGIYSFEIKINLLPDNDECIDAVALVANTATMGTTVCATQEAISYDSGVCDAGDTDETNTVWYEVTVGPGEKGFNLTITGTGAMPISGNINAVLFETSAAGCVVDASTFVEEDCMMSATLSQQFECVGEGTYIIRISTSDGNAGVFDILFEPLLLVQPNDNCDAPDLALDTGAECEWILATANTEGACPEDLFLDPTGCGLSSGSVVWYEVTAPPTAIFLDLQINTDAGSNPFIAVFPGSPADCDNQTFLAGTTCFEGLFTELDDIGQAQIPVTGSSTYLIAIGITDPVGGMINFGIKWITPPVNDECADAITLVGNVATDGTTDCATQPIGGEYNSGVCTDEDEENTVWFTYEVPATDKGFNVTINAIFGAPGFTGDLNFVVFEPDPIGSCDVTAGTMVDEICTASAVINEDFECIGPGTYVIRISTSSDNEGDFTITIEPLAIVQPNDFCDAPDIIAFDAQLECEWMNVDASTVDACPESFDFASNCGFDDFPVVWYQATAPANAEFLDLQINSGGVNPFIGVFEFTIDCDNMSPVAGSGCYTGTFDELDDIGQLQIDITPGSTYLIGVGTDNTMGNIIDFSIKWITPPINDECVDAIELTPNMIGIEPSTFTTGPIAGTTQCATEPLTGSACDDDKTNTVWYTYTVEADVKEITIDITNWINTVIPQGMPDFSVAVLDGCPPATFLNQADGSVADYCGGVGEDLIKLSCLDEGDVITILVSSSAENEGSFDITLNTAMPNCTYTNDDCINAEPLTPIPLDTDEDCIITAGCNDLACSDFNFAACGGIDQLNAVFYTFTTDADADEAFVNIEILNGEAGELDAPGAVLFNGDCITPLSIGACGSGAGGEYNSGPLGGPGFIMANTIYTVMIFNSDVDQNGGTFDLCVTVSSGCVNDEPCDAFTLEPNVTVVNPASSENCTPEISISGCGPDFDEATLWYQVEVPEGFSYFEIILVNGAVPDGVGEGLGEVSIAVGPLDDCNNIIAGDVMYSDCDGFTTNGGAHPIPCAIEYGTYYVQIGSLDELDAGDFEITFTPLDDVDPPNDLCSQAEELVVSDFCEFFPFTGDLKDACPELNDVNACLFSENSAVWYKITIPDGVPVVSDMDILIEGLGSPILGVYEFDCSQVSEPSMGIVSTPNLGDGSSAGCVEMDLAEGILITPGNEYYILVSSSTNEQLLFTINIKLNAPPINDDPCDTSINPPFDLTGGGSHNGTTCCARGPNDTNADGSAADFNNQDCSAATEDAAVWYQFTPSEADDGYNIILEPGDMEGPASVEVYTGAPGAGCTGALTVIESSCNSNNADIKIGNCFAPGDILYVKVTTDDPDENCGTFFLTIVPASCGPMADDCIDLADQTPIEPVTNPMFFIDYFCVDGCLDYACPEASANGGCGAFTQMPTVWFQVTTDDLAAQMFTTVEPNGNWEPIWSVYSGPDCDNLSVVNFGGSPPCSNGDNTPELHQTSVFDDEENYWIAITIDPTSLPATGLDDGSFELCVATTINAIICLGELEGGACDDESLTMEVIDREIEGQPLDGPFCQGEEITINISFFYDASETGQDWLIGFVPVFGTGWDLTGFDYPGNAPVGNGTAAVWYEEGSECAPILQEPNPILCTYTDDNGNLQLCNLLCSPCSECEQPFMYPNDPLPSGYFWVSNGGNTGCDNDCSPGEGWGIGSVQSQIDWTFTLMVKEFDNFDDCFENRDLSISFQTFSDGTAGCWEDPVGECLLDRAMFSPVWEIECEIPPEIEGPDQEICHDGVLDIFVQTVDGSTSIINVDVEDNPNVDGEMSHVFLDGTGTIDDDLTNTSNDVQIVIYNVYSVDETLPCPGITNQIEVTIYPELMATFPPTFVCDGECIDLIPDIVGGTGVPYTYVWSTGETTPSINVCPLVPTTYSVTVEDGLGCMDIADVQVDVKPPVEISLPESIDVCKDDSFDPNNPDYEVCLTFDSGSAPFGISWNPEFGLVGTPTGTFGECWAINEMVSSEFAGNNGQYVLSVTVTDFFGCTAETDMLVNITGPITIVLNVQDLECGDTEAIINVTGIDAIGNPVTKFLLYGGCPDNGLGDFLDEINPNNGSGNFPPQDLLSYTCFTVVAVTEAGCESSQDITIPLTEGIPIEITGTPEVCIGEDATITITNATDYESFVWTPILGSTGSVTFTPDSTFTYFVEATDATGCKSQEVFTVVVNDPPVISMSGTTTFCEGGTATVTASGGTIYTWSDNGGGATGDTYTTGTEGDVTLVMQDANGCESDSMITFTQEDIVTISLGDQNICDGMGDTVFVSNDFINVEWYDATPDLVSSTNFYVITGAGSFTVEAIDGATGCDAIGSFVVMDFMTPMISVTDTVEVCREDSGVDSLCVNFNSQVSGATGIWSQLDPIPGFIVDLSDLNNVCFEGAQSGCYAFIYTTNSAQIPCEDVSETLMVCVKACPCPDPATTPIDPICNIGTTNLEDAELTSDPGTWSVQSGPAGQGLTGILTGTIFDANGILPGNYIVRFTLDNPGGPACELYTEQVITVFAAPMIIANNSFMCNIDNGTDPIVLDLFDLINVDGTDGGIWVQILGTTVPITGGSTIMSSDLSTFPDTLTFEYTSGVEMGSPCPPAVVTVEVIVRDCNCPFINVLPDTLCNNGIVIDLNDLLDNPDGLIGTWSTTGILVGADMFDPSGLTSGQYVITYTLDVSPGPNCEIAYSNNILVRRQSIAVPTEGDPPCSVDTGNGPTTTNLYDWLESNYSSGTWTQTGGTPNLSFTDNGLDMAEVDFVMQPAGSMFIFTFTTNDAQDPCSNISVDVTITVLDCNCPPIMITPAADLCNDAGMLDLCALTAGSDPGTFTVATIGGTDVSGNITGGCIFDATGVNPGEYVITYTLDQTVTGTCIQFVQETFTVIQYLTSEIEDPDEVCNDPDGMGTTSLNFTDYVTNAGNGNWEDTEGAGVAISTLPEQQSVSFVGVPAGTYTFTYTIENVAPCENVVLTMEVVVTDDCNCPPINPGDPADECNTDGPIDLTQYDDPDNPGTWSSTELTVENGNSLVIADVTSGTYILLYTVDVIVEDCDTTTEVLIFIGEPANAGTPVDERRLCEGVDEVIDLFSLLEGEDIGGAWTETSTTASTGFSNTAGTFTTGGDVAGTYTFEYMISENAPCPDVSAPVTVVIEANPVADAGMADELNCTNKTEELGGASTTGADIEYTWVNTTTGEVVGNTITIDVTDAGLYELTVLNTATGCSARDEVEVIKSDDLPTMIVTERDITCFGFDNGGIVISGQSGGIEPYSYILNEGTPTLDANAFNTLPADNYSIVIVDAADCASDPILFTINEPGPFAIDAGPDIVGELGETFELTIEPFDTTGIISIIWSNFETAVVICNGLDCKTISVTPTDVTTTYYVEVINGNGCIAFDDVQIRTTQIVDVVFPNIISPNGDNINDRFYVKSADVETVISMKIFDRWGEKLYDASNLPPRDPSVGWDGKFNDKKVVPGVFVFIVEVLFIDGTTETFNGDVTVTDSE